MMMVTTVMMLVMTMTMTDDEMITMMVMMMTDGMITMMALSMLTIFVEPSPYPQSKRRIGRPVVRTPNDVEYRPVSASLTALTAYRWLGQHDVWGRLRPQIILHAETTKQGLEGRTLLTLAHKLHTTTDCGAWATSGHNTGTRDSRRLFFSQRPQYGDERLTPIVFQPVNVRSAVEVVNISL